MQSDRSITDWQTKARAICNGSQVVITPKRLEVYTALLKAGQPMSAYDLIEAVNAEFARHLTPISIYRMLEFLEQKHLVRKLKSAGKYLAITPKLEANCEQVSQFLICGTCGDVKEFGVNQRLLVELKTFINSTGFQLNTMELELDCICMNCLIHFY